MDFDFRCVDLLLFIFRCRMQNPFCSGSGVERNPSGSVVARGGGLDSGLPGAEQAPTAALRAEAVGMVASADQAAGSLERERGGFGSGCRASAGSNHERGRADL